MKLVLAAAALAAGAVLAQDDALRLRATELIGMEVAGRSGETLGEISDLVIDGRIGRLQHAVVAYGGWLGFGARHALVPYARFAPAPDGDRLLLDMTRAEMARVPRLETPVWPAMLASALVGSTVRDRLGRDAGELQDLVISLSAGHVDYAIVDPKDGWRDRSFAAPVTALDLRQRP